MRVKMLEHVIAERLDLDPMFNAGIYEVDDKFAAELVRLRRATQVEVPQQQQQKNSKPYEGVRR